MSTTVCAATPTLTRIDVLTSTSLITTFSESTSTIPGETSTTTFTSFVCDITGVPITTDISATGCTLSTSESVITGDPSQMVLQIPVTQTADALFTETTTLFNVSCSTIPIPSNSDTTPLPPSTTPPPPPSSVNSPATRSTNTTEIPSLTNGDHTSTATLQSSVSSGKKTAIGAVLGGVIGGVVLFAVVLWLCWRFLIKPSVGNSILFKSTQPGATGPAKTKNMLDDEDDYPEKTEYIWTNQPPPSPSMLHPSNPQSQYSPHTPTTFIGAQQLQYPDQLHHQSKSPQVQDIHQQQRYAQFEWGSERVPTRAEGKQRAANDYYGGTLPPLSQIPGTPTSPGSMFSAPSSAYSHQGLLADSIQPAIPSQVMEQYKSAPPSVVGQSTTLAAQPAVYKPTNTTITSPTGLYRRGYTDSSGSPSSSIS